MPYQVVHKPAVTTMYPKQTLPECLNNAMSALLAFTLTMTVMFKGLASQCKAQEKYKERLDLGLTWLKWLPTGMESKTRLAPRSNKVNSQKLTLDWNTSLCYRVIWKWHQSAFHANNHAIGGGSNGIIHLGWRPHTFLLHTNIDSTNSNTNRTNITEMAFKRFAVEIRLLLLKKCSHWKRWSTITSTGRTD